MGTSTSTRFPIAQPVRMVRNAVTILLVDDDAMVRELLRTILTMAGYTVITAPDGPSALEVASRSSFDMLITDFQMPGMDGCTLATCLTEARSRLPVLVVSGADPDDLPLDNLSRRKWNYLPKPVNHSMMCRIIDNECFDRTSQLAQFAQRLA